MDGKKNKVIEFLLIALAFGLPLIFYTGTKDAFLIKSTALSSVIAFILIYIVLKNARIETSGIVLPLAVFSGVMLLSLVNSKNLLVSIHAIVEALSFLAVCLILAGYGNTGFREKFLSASALSGFLVCVYGLLQAGGLDFVNWATNFDGRISSSVGNPNFLGGYLVALIPLALALALERSKFAGKLFFGFTAVLMVFTLVLTQTRGSWVAFAFSFIVFMGLAALLAGRKAKFAVKAAVSAAILLVVLGLVYSARFDNPYSRKLRSIFNPNIVSVSERIFKWRTAWEMIKAHPVLGVGAGTIKVNYALYQAEAKKEMRIILRGTSESQVHNEYLQAWAETGTTGLASFMLILVVFFARAIRGLKTATAMPWIQIGIISAVSGTLVDSLSNFPLHIVPTSFFFWSYLGMSFRADGDNLKRFDFRNILIKIPVVTIILVVFLKVILAEFVADALRRKADLDFQSENYAGAIAGYEKAHNLSPVNGRICYDLGMAYVKTVDYPSAVKAFKESIKLRNYGEVYNDLANCYYLMGNLPEAVQNWETAVKLELPDSETQEKVRHNLRLLKK